MGLFERIQAGMWTEAELEAQLMAEADANQPVQSRDYKQSQPSQEHSNEAELHGGQVEAVRMINEAGYM